MGKELEVNSVAFNYEGVDILRDSAGLLNLTTMWKAQGSPANQDPRQWRRKEGAGFIKDLAKTLDVPVGHIAKASKGGKGGGGETWAHWQVAVAYAKYLSHKFHRHVNAAYVEYEREQIDPGLKAERAIKAYERAGKSMEWIGRRFSGIGNRNQLTATMADHNCKVRGKDNPFAEGTRSISLAVLGKTPKEIRSEKGLAKSARTRDHLPVEDLISIEWAEIQARKLMVNEGADGNSECVDACKRAGRAVKIALAALTA